MKPYNNKKTIVARLAIWKSEQQATRASNASYSLHRRPTQWDVLDLLTVIFQHLSWKYALLNGGKAFTPYFFNFRNILF